VDREHVEVHLKCQAKLFAAFEKGGPFSQVANNAQCRSERSLILGPKVPEFIWDRPPNLKYLPSKYRR
jgi:hypothetical protein